MNINELKQFPASLCCSGRKVELFLDQPVSTETYTARVINQKVGDTYVYRTFTLSNLSNLDTPQITEPYVIDTKIPCGDSVRFHTIAGDNCSKESFLPIDRTLTDGDAFTLEPYLGRSSNTTAFPIFDFAFGDTALLVAVGWSGQWKCEIAVRDQKLCIRVGLAYADFYLKSGELVKLPSVCLVTADSAPAVRREFRRLLTTEFSPIPKSYPNDHLPISIQPFDRYNCGIQEYPFWRTEAGQIETLGNAVKCRYMDTFWIDAAWFRDGFPSGVGNYEFAPGFPNGLKPVSDAVHEKGMRFMVWFEPERIARGSDVFHNLFHYCLTKTENIEREDNFLYNLGDEDAWQWLYNTLSGFIRDNGIDNYRQDFNIDPLPFWLYNDEERRVGMTEIKYINGFYRLWDTLKKEFPHLFIDNCASGGRRIDFETLRRAVPMWRSDITCSRITEERHNDVYNQNETLTLGEYLPYHACAVWEPIPNDTRSAATAGLACTYDILNPEFDFDMARALLSEISENASLWTGNFYPLTQATLDEDGYSAFQLVKGDRGYAVVFRRADCTVPTFRLCLNEIDETADYTLTLTDETMQKTTSDVSGKTLAAGIDVTLPDPHTSLTAIYCKK